MITAHPLIQVHLIAPQLLLWIALPHHGDIMLATNYLFCRCYSVPFGQHAVVWSPLNALIFGVTSNGPVVRRLFYRVRDLCYRLNIFQADFHGSEQSQGSSVFDSQWLAVL